MFATHQVHSDVYVWRVALDVFWKCIFNRTKLLVFRIHCSHFQPKKGIFPTVVFIPRMAVSSHNSGLLIKQRHTLCTYIYFVICWYLIYLLMNWYLLKWTKYQFCEWDTNYGYDESEIKRNCTISHSIIFDFYECVYSLRMHLYWEKMNAKVIFDVCHYSAWTFDKHIWNSKK